FREIVAVCAGVVGKNGMREGSGGRNFRRVVLRILFVAECAAIRPMNMAGPRKVPSSAAFPLIPPKPVTSPAAKRPGIGAPIWFNTRQRRSTPTPHIVFLVIGKNRTA